MIEIKIPKEVTKYEAKLIGPFTSRQCVALVIFVPLAVLTYNFARAYLGASVAPYLCCIVAAPGALFGWVKPYGMKFEEFASSVVINGFIAPMKRKHISENYYSLISKTAKNLTPKDELLLDAIVDEIPEEELEKMLKQQKKEGRIKKDKYKKSPRAIF